MSRKKLDPRIRTLIQNGIRTNHRSFFVIIGDHGKDQVVNLHYILTKSQVAKRPNVLWCYKKDLGFSSHKQKRIKAAKKKQKVSKVDTNEEDPFELFISSTDIRYAYYKETDRILGKTFGMCVLQDFEALEPNYLARTIETVQGGGVVVLLIKTLTSLKQLYTMTMDVHARYRSGDHKHDAVARFNERFLLSLTSCETCLVLDDKLDVLPITSRFIEEIPESLSESSELVELKKSLSNLPTGKLVSLAKTMDQARAIIAFTDVVTAAMETASLRNTISLTAGRGRGKSAALGLTIAASLNAGLSNVFLTSPSPENLGTLFEFLFKGLDSFGYEEHLDYEIIQSTYAEFNKAIVRVNIKKRGQSTRQTVLYISPQDSHLLGQAELVVIDEAAAIPLPLVQKLITGPYLVFLSSTINGYEGTGRSLSLKLLHSLRSNPNKNLCELQLAEPIRYNSGDPVERWLNNLLCLDCQNTLKPASGTLPHPDKCELFQVNRDTLFSYHKASEAFLQRMMSLYVASHYKNSPNDLQLMSDAPGHRLFVLLGPVDPTSASLPDILAVVQVAFEGRLARESVLRNLQRGKRDSGDLIPWTISTQFMDGEFGEMSGARIVRIAVHPEMQSMGYGGRALQQLFHFYSGEFGGTEEADDDKTTHVTIDNDDNALMTEKPKPRANLAPLLLNVTDIKQDPLHWLGTSFGLTHQLFKFWHKHSFLPTYLRQTANDITGEHTILMLRSLKMDTRGVAVNHAWLQSLNQDFIKRFTGFLGGQFRGMTPTLSLSILNYGNSSKDSNDEDASFTSSASLLASLFTAHDLHRLESYASNTSELYLISDLLPLLSALHFSPLPFTSLQKIHLSPVQAAILLVIGLQRRDVVDAEKELSLPKETVMAMVVKCIRKMIVAIKEARLSNLESVDPTISISTINPGTILPKNVNLPSIEEDLQSGAMTVTKELADRQTRLLSALDLTQYEIDVDGDALESDLKGRKNFDGIISMKSGINRKTNRKDDGIIDKIAQKVNEGKKRRPILKR